MKPLIICRGPIRMEAMCVFEEMGISGFGILLSEKDSIVYANALSPELRKSIDPSHIHRVQDYSGASGEERGERIEQIIGIARQHGYDSIFAGYGFMAEDEDMVAAMESAGLNFIGPCSNTIKGAGRKDLAKRTALQVNVSVTPGIDNATILTLLRLHKDEKALQALVEEQKLSVSQSEMDGCETLELLAEMILNAAYKKRIDLFSTDDLAITLSEQVRQLFTKNPENRIRLKAIGGGGGKGQRILDCPTLFKGSASEQLALAVKPVESMLLEVLSEVKATGVGDNKNVLAEINIETVRHEEIQVVGNGDWCITMGGRDCSIQMNEQKLLEISVTVEELEEAIEEAAKNGKEEAVETLKSDLNILQNLEAEAAKFGAAVGLDSVSTFESIVDGSRHFFMEMNTRVQVEHRVTELCYRLRFVNPDDSNDTFAVDSIVELMVLLAEHGSRMPMPSRERRDRCALEVRLNATDHALKPHAGGIVNYWSDTIEGEIRDDQGICLHNPDTNVFVKYHLAGAYDSNIALLLTTGANREESFARMAEILRQTKLAGENLATNLEFHYGLINWLIGNDVNARPATNFVSPYLTAVGQLRKLANRIDIVYAYNEIQSQQLKNTDDAEAKAAIQNILSQKTSLLARALNIMLEEPHYLSGWLALNRQHFEIVGNAKNARIEWLSNPVIILSDLYRYLNMEARNGKPALYVIWDHDQAVLEEAIEFYNQLDERLDCDSWKSLCEFLASSAAEKEFGDSISDVRGAHMGFQLGMEILSVLPYIGHSSRFFELKVNANLMVDIPEHLSDAEVSSESLRALSPPPDAAADEVATPSGGMFYAREAPDRDAFIVKGQHFEKGDPLFIVEVMKMFNKVYAPFSGTVDEILIDADSTIVKKGQVVFRVTPDEIVIEEPEDDMRAARIETTNSFLAFASH
jgi:acetyl/propionyl-CoA carboxylase alpha subunit